VPVPRLPARPSVPRRQPSPPSRQRSTLQRCTGDRPRTGADGSCLLTLIAFSSSFLTLEVAAAAAASEQDVIDPARFNASVVCGDLRLSFGKALCDLVGKPPSPNRVVGLVD
jgi:hypothetical protein